MRKRTRRKVFDSPVATVSDSTYYPPIRCQSLGLTFQARQIGKINLLLYLVPFVLEADFSSHLVTPVLT